NRSGKAVAEKTKSPKQGKKTSASSDLKPVLYGSKRNWSKGIFPLSQGRKT
ncbi:hypothetical protein A2U01_0070653, partial [Trifolium medium]|nr:hypothetical protein [Trifolium medium]